MPGITITVNGNPIRVDLPEPGDPDIRSVFLIGMPKAGSTLLNRIMRPLSKGAGLTPFSLHNTLWSMGVDPHALDADIAPLFRPYGYTYLGFRGWAAGHPVPDCASGRTVFLMRDPRDMVTSQYFSEAFSHEPPGAEADPELLETFKARRAALQARPIDDYVLEMAPVLRTRHDEAVARLASVEYRIWRYEDIIFDKLRWVHEMLDYLGLEVPQDQIRREVDGQDIRPRTEAVDQHVRKVTPGDHRAKLRPDTIAALNEVFAGILDIYGYDRV